MQEQLFCKNSRTKVMVFSQLVRNQILQYYQLPAESIVTVPLGVDLHCFHPATNGKATRSGGLKLLFIAHNFRLKGLHCLLAALARARQTGLKAELLIAGNGDRTRYTGMIEQLGLTEQVRFLGVLDQPGTAELYRTCDALAHPTFTDHCSLVVIEALASGLPVITTRQNGAAELIQEDKHGIIIDHARETDALVRALIQLQDRQKLAAMSTAAAGLRARLDFNDHARQVLAWLENH
jgi:UDP-glucose:(heptosyl)LPS alpha-1,3-glucosyltransferase